MGEYSQGDGAAILCNGVMLTVDEIVERLNRLATLEAEKAEYEREKLKREAQEPVAFRWLGPGKGWRAVYAEPPVPHVDPDWLSNVIRTVDGNHTMVAGALAEKIAEAINGRSVK